MAAILPPFLARIVPQGDPAYQTFRVTAIDPSVGIWPGPGGELPPYPDIGFPLPQPPFPGGGGGSPPYPSHPIAGGPWPSHPIFFPPGTRPPWAGGGQPPGGGGGGGPVDPGYSPPWAQVPGGGGPAPSPGPGFSARVIPIPPQDPPVEPPEGMPADSTQVLIYFGPGTMPAMAWVAPYASTGPVQPPEQPAK